MPRPVSAALLSGLLLLALIAPASAHPEVTDDPDHDDDLAHILENVREHDPEAELQEHDDGVDETVSAGPSAKVTKNLALAGRGERLVPNATTDVWVHERYAYLGTFNEPCGTGEGSGTGPVDLVQDVEGPGIPVFDVRNPTKPTYVGSIPSVEGSRINDVKVASLTQGDILVHSNEACDGGPGGFEVYNVDDPLNPVHLAHVQTDDVNALLREDFGFTDFGVHNLNLFTRDGRDYAAAQVEGLLGSFQVFDITDPSAAELVSWFGAESVQWPDVDWATTEDFGLILEANSYLFSGFGASQNRFLHDHFVSEDGLRAYLANWDAGLLLVNLSTLGQAAELVSVALRPDVLDGEVNSHSVWPTADERIVVEGEEDFAPFASIFTIESGDAAGEYPSAEGAITIPIADLPGQRMAGPTVFVGRSCTGDPLPQATAEGQIALIQRGDCTFTQKLGNAAAAGYAGAVVFNHLGDALVTMGGNAVDLPGVFVGLSTGLLIAGVDSVDDLVLGAPGEEVSASVVANRWSGLRVWDYSDPANPVLASTFDTPCSADPTHATCDPRGTYSSHNVIVEGTKAYISWYAEGVLVVDVADPYNPVEVARYHESGPEFEARNAGIQDVWGIHKEPRRPWIYASDRNGGLYVLKELGAGSAGRR